MYATIHNTHCALLYRLLFYRERGASAYSTLAYWSAILVSCIPLTTLNTLVFSLLLYYMCGLNTASFGLFVYFFLTLLLCNLVALRYA
jgi:ABC-2 type transporter